MSSNIVSQSILSDRLNASSTQIAAFCDRWGVTELALFGSVLGEDFKPDQSDIDVLVTFDANYSWTYDAAFQMREELMAQQIQRYCLGITRTQFEQDDEKQAAVLYRIGVIGEAVKHISPTFRDRYPDIPWKQIVGMRESLCTNMIASILNSFGMWCKPKFLSCSPRSRLYCRPNLSESG